MNMEITEEYVAECIQEAEKVFRGHALSGEEIGAIWHGIQLYCLFQMKKKKGAFYDMWRSQKKKTIKVD